VKDGTATCTPSIYMGDRPDLVKRLDVLQDKYRLKKAAVIKVALDACLDDIEKNVDKRMFKLNGKEVMFI